MGGKGPLRGTYYTRIISGAWSEFDKDDGIEKGGVDPRLLIKALCMSFTSTFYHNLRRMRHLQLVRGLSAGRNVYH